MKRVIAALFGTITGLVLLLSFKTNGSTAVSARPAVTATGPDTASSEATTPAPSSSSPSPSPSPSTSTSSAAKASASKTITGDSIDTRWGPVQVRITVTNGKLASVTAVD